MPRTLTETQILNSINGWEVGGNDGIIICDGCGARIEGDSSQEWTAYVTSPRNRPAPHHVLKVYCPECDDREISTGTAHIDELMVTWKPVENPKTGQHHVKPCEVVARSTP
jgi:hypothetical protein